MQFVVLFCVLLACGSTLFADSSSDLQSLIDRAQVLFDQQKYAAAIPELEQAVKIKPDIRGAYYQLGFSYWRLGRNADAIQAFTKELALPPPDPYSLYYLGRIYLERNDLAAATKYLEASVKAGGVLDARDRLGSAYLKIGKIDQAILTLSAAVQNNAEDDSAHYLLGRAYQRKGDATAARREFALVKTMKGTVQLSTAALLRLSSELQNRDLTAAAATARELESSGDSEAMIKAGQNLGQAGMVAESIDLFKKAVALQPRSADAQYDLGRSYAALNAIDPSIESLRRAVALKPEMYEAQLLLGTMLVNAGRSAEAIPFLAKAAELHRGDPRLLTMLGLQYLDNRYYGEASDALEKSIKLDATNPDPYFLLIQVDYRSDRYEAALNLAEEAVKRFPNLAMSHFHYGVQLENLNRLDQAKAELEKTIRMDPTLTGAALSLGDVFYKLGKPEKSLAEFETVVANDPSQADAWSGIGKALIELKKYEDAEFQMRRAIAIHKDVPSLHLYLAQALRALGRADDSKKEAAVFNTLTLQRAKMRDQDAERSYVK
jgi:tetratricopeptide (TPR) repeat protein